jgi:hypothetical protein
VTSALERGLWSASRLYRFTPGKDPVPIVQEAGWAPREVWTCAKNFAPIGIGYPDRPIRSQSVYEVVSKIFWTGSAIYTAVVVARNTVDRRTTMSSESVFQVALAGWMWAVYTRVCLDSCT